MRRRSRHMFSARPVRWLALLALALGLAACATDSPAIRNLFAEGTPPRTDAPSLAPTSMAPESIATTARDRASGASPAKTPKDNNAPSYLASLQKKIDAAFTPDKPSRAQRQKLGDDLTRKVLQQVKLARNNTERRRVEAIVRRLAQAARQESDWPRQWRVYLVDEKSADAFTAGGGNLFITTGMVDLLRTDERIATVLAHEMAHNLLGHVWAAKVRKDMARRAHRFSREVLGDKMRMGWLGDSLSFLVNTSLNIYSRQQEYDADAEGLHLLVLAGYRPQVALETFDYLKRHFREQSAVKNFFYSNHPLYHRRRWYLANRIRAYYRAQAGLPPVRRANWVGKRHKQR